MNARKRLARRGFSLIELMISMSIIALLIALLLPAVNSVTQRVRITQAVVDMHALGTALSQFKAQFGTYPPSKIVICEDPADWDSTTDTIHSKSIIRGYWPNFDFTAFHDVNDNGSTSEVITLDPSECLVFFLGGKLFGYEDVNRNGVLDMGEDLDGNGRLEWGKCCGFSKNPADPFEKNTTGSVGVRFYDFNMHRLVDVDGDSFPEYLDTIPGQRRPLVYLSSYDGSGYRTTDCAAFTTPGSLQSHYFHNAAPWMDSSFQIISAGFDSEYGVGGEYWMESPSGGIPATRSQEWDNLANFAEGKLDGN